MQLSHRITNLTPGGDDGWGLFYRAVAMRKAGEPIVELTIGEHDIRTDSSILAAMGHSARGGHTGYASVPGTDALRTAVAQRLTERTGVATTLDNVLITPGGQSALFAAHTAVLNPGDGAGFIDPYYASYPGTVRGAGGAPIAIEARPEDGFQPAEAALRAALTGARSLMINTPNNPTGMVYDQATVAGIARVCCDLDLWLISDEVYDTQVWEGRHISPRTLPGMAERTLVVGSMSKSHAMTGSRIGWLVGPEEAIAHVTNLATHTTYGVPGYIQDAATFALGEGSALEEKIGAPFRRRRDLARRVLGEQTLVRNVPAMGAMYVMLDIRATGLTGTAFADRLLDTHRIAVMPGESFGRAAAGHLRVAMTVEDSAFEAALRQLCAFAKEIAE